MRPLMRSEPRRSGGFKLLDPAGMMANLSFINTITSFNLTAPVKKSTSPLCCSILKKRDVDGWRRSASTKATFCPVEAADIARLTAIVDFPSLGHDDVM